MPFHGLVPFDFCGVNVFSNSWTIFSRVNVPPPSFPASLSMFVSGITTACSQVSAICGGAFRLPFSLAESDRWRKAEACSTIFIFLMLQYTNTSERSCDTAAIVSLCCGDF